jgi:carboxyl-terminal processing protease
MAAREAEDEKQEKPRPRCHGGRTVPRRAARNFAVQRACATFARLMRRARSVFLLGLVGALGALGALGVALRRSSSPGPAGSAGQTPPDSVVAGGPDGGPRSEATKWAGRTLELPTGVPVAVSCWEARQIVGQARSRLASEPGPVDPRKLADATVDWLDPHGLWSASPDAPLATFLRKHDKELVREIEAPIGTGGCPLFDEAGTLIAQWVTALATILDDASRHAQPMTKQEALQLASEPAFEDQAVRRSARDLAHDLGRTIGAVGLSFGDPVRSFTAAARERFVPSLSPAGWSRALLAAALRAYLPQIDPHGGWAPLDEETSLYEVDLEAFPPPRLWDRMARTALGVRIESGAASPLLDRDVVLSVGQIALGGLSVEQAEQVAIFDNALPLQKRSVVVLRQGDDAPRSLDVSSPGDPTAETESGELPVERIAYADGDALVVEIGDVPDDLGDLLAVTIAKARAAGPPVGIILDLRGNGGGSTDGADAALGLFLPGAPLFPMKRRDGVIETERATEPPETDRWPGPVAALVDADTASAAEMIAGALSSYRRGVVAGQRTYGKGCAQEYMDDEVRAGVLRLTTLVYALPDGSPVQRVGLQPTVFLGSRHGVEREATLAHAMPVWRGPDVRDHDRVREVPWPAHRGRVGPCRDDSICRTLHALGAPRGVASRGRR